MKKRIIAMLLAMTMCLSLAACGSGSSETTAASSGQESSTSGSSGSGDEIKVSFVLKTTAAEVYQIIIAGAKAYEAEHEGVVVDIQGASSETAYDEQQNIIETDLSSGEYAAMIIHPSQPDMVTTLVEGATIPIIDFESVFDAPEVTSYVGIPQYDAASLGGETAVELAKARGWSEINAIAIAGIQGDNNSEARLGGYQNGVNSAGGNFLADEVQYSNSVADQAVNCMEGIMQNHPEGVAIIVCHNDDVAMAAKRAAAGNSAYDNTVFCGFDGISSACEAILEGNETMSVACDWYLMGYRSVEAAVQAAQGETVDEEIYIDAYILDESNAQETYDEIQSYL